MQVFLFRVPLYALLQVHNKGDKNSANEKTLNGMVFKISVLFAGPWFI